MLKFLNFIKAIAVISTVVGYFYLGNLFGGFNIRIWLRRKEKTKFMKILRFLLWPLESLGFNRNISPYWADQFFFDSFEEEELSRLSGEIELYKMSMFFLWPLKILWNTFLIIIIISFFIFIKGGNKVFKAITYPVKKILTR